MKAVLWMMGTLASFTFMAITARELGDNYTPFQLVFTRSFVGLVLVTILLAYFRQFHLIKSPKMPIHVGRNLINFVGQYSWFLGISLLPLANVFALEFTVPLWTLLIACWFLNEAFTKTKAISLLLGFFGVLVIVKPGADIFDPASFVVILAAVSFSTAYVCTKYLAKTEPPLVIIFLMCLIQLPIGFALSYQDWQLPTGIEWLYLFVVGVCGLTAHFCIARAMLHADAGVVVSLDFFRLPIIAVVGMWLYNEALDWWVLLGGILMLIGNIINVNAQRKSSQRPTITESD
ncbi:DMT family transporter [Vibrio sp. S9_S30]|uniref:DMT family transporter n=1 Tax=Vibrio sp. S9_S30 TaxID=2720226 RepID=UPI001681B34F|nr:DMT family transporter [Vibrio sp. S9_S30]